MSGKESLKSDQVIQGRALPVGCIVVDKEKLQALVAAAKAIYSIGTCAYNLSIKLASRVGNTRFEILSQFNTKLDNLQDALKPFREE